MQKSDHSDEYWYKNTIGMNAFVHYPCIIGPTGCSVKVLVCTFAVLWGDAPSSDVGYFQIRINNHCFYNPTEAYSQT